jgi:hypothetical protein
MIVAQCWVRRRKKRNKSRQGTAESHLDSWNTIVGRIRASAVPFESD